MAKPKNRIFAVFGLDIFGETLADNLIQLGGGVIVIDNNPALIDSFKNKATAALLLDATDEKALSKAPLDDVDTAIITPVDNIGNSIITTAILKQRGIPYIISCSVSDIHSHILSQVGAHEVLNIQQDTGIWLAQRLIAPEILEIIPVTQDFSITEYNISDTYVGKTVFDIPIIEKFNIKIILIKRKNITVDSEGNPIHTEIIIFPQETDVLQDSDILLVVGKNTDLTELKNIV